MGKQAKFWAKDAGLQLSQSDAYAVLAYSKSVRLEGATHNQLRSFVAPIYKLQTETEKKVRETVELNGVGFAKFQAPMLSRFAQTGAFDDADKLRDAIGYHWAQIMLLCGFWQQDTEGAANLGKLKQRKYGEKGTQL